MSALTSFLVAPSLTPARRLVLFLSVCFAAIVPAPVAGAWTWPVDGPVLQAFVFDPANPYAGGQHRGIDIGSDSGGAVVAPAAGTVTFAGTVPSSGKSLTITTSDGFVVTLTHLGSLAVQQGATLAEGDPAGTIGPSGDPELPQPYVHLGVRIGARDQGYVDPISLLPARVQVSTPGAGSGSPPPAASPAPGAAGTRTGRDSGAGHDTARRNGARRNGPPVATEPVAKASATPPVTPPAATPQATTAPAATPQATTAPDTTTPAAARPVAAPAVVAQSLVAQPAASVPASVPAAPVDAGGSRSSVRRSAGRRGP